LLRVNVRIIMACANLTERAIGLAAFVALAAGVGACSDDSSTSVVSRDAGPDAVAVAVDASADSPPATDAVVADVATSDASSDTSLDVSADVAQLAVDASDAGSDSTGSADVSSDGSSPPEAGDDGGGSLPPLEMCDLLNQTFGPVDDAGDYDPTDTWGAEMAADYVDGLTADCRVSGIVPTDIYDTSALGTQVASFTTVFFGCMNSDNVPPTLDELLPPAIATNPLTSGDVAAIAQAYVGAIPTMLDNIGAEPLTHDQATQVAARMAAVTAAWTNVTSAPGVYTYSQCVTDDGGTEATAEGGADAAAVDAAASDGTTADAGAD
jgi:hypothetical protein